MTTTGITRSAALPTRHEEMVRRDEEPPLPFQALDRLAQVRGALDQEVALLIGQLQPYVTQNPSPPMALATGRVAGEDPPGYSSLEERIEKEMDALREVHDQLADLRSGLRL